jgi:hypothetical protein
MAQGDRIPIDVSTAGGRQINNLANALQTAQGIATALNQKIGGFVADDTNCALFLGCSTGDLANLKAEINGAQGELIGVNVYQVNVGGRSMVNEVIAFLGQ